MAGMGIEDVLQAIESEGTGAEFALCTDLHDMLVVAYSLPVVERLRQMAAGDTAVAEMLVSRVDELLREDVKSDTRHPYDHAIALYLVVLSWTNVDLLGVAIEDVLSSKLSTLWFALIAALHLRAAIPNSHSKQQSTLTVPSSQDIVGRSYVG